MEKEKGRDQERMAFTLALGFILLYSWHLCGVGTKRKSEGLAWFIALVGLLPSLSV